jgi:hypothetical protein
MSRLRPVLAGALARYPQGAGHWACFLQYILGLRDLGHDVLWLDVLVSTGTRADDESRAQLLPTTGRTARSSRRPRPRRRSRRTRVQSPRVPHGIIRQDLQGLCK